MNKICIYCKENKKLDEFPNRKGSKDGKRNDCKICNKKRMKIRKKKFRDANLEYCKAQEKISRDKNRETRKKYEKTYYIKNKEYMNARTVKREKERYNTDIEFKIIYNIRNSIKRFMTAGEKGNNRSSELIGCTFKFFFNWIKYNCELDGLDIKKIHIDHIYPLSKYNNNNWTNLYPLTEKENKEKGNKEPPKEYIEKVKIRINDFKKINGINI